MARIVPSQIARVIEQAYQWAKEAADGLSAYNGSLGPDHSPNIAMILELLRALPEELLPTDPDDALTIEAVKGAMSGALTSWSGGPHPGAAAALGPLQMFRGKHPVVALLLALRKCKDEAPSASVPDLAFITDGSARASLRVDISTAFRAHGNGEYKAATVIAGAVVEAILLWRIKQLSQPTVDDAIKSCDARHPSYKLAGQDPERWNLVDLIDVAADAGILHGDKRKLCDLSREFRNLIHPGRVLRTGADASKATALTALAAMQTLLQLP